MLDEQQATDNEYLIPRSLNPFQRELYKHLIRWKRRQLPGATPGRSRGREYDAILPDECKTIESTPLLYEAARQELLRHRHWNPFRIHQHFFHMASSQAANINLFLPILGHSRAAEIFRQVRPDFATLATDRLHNGYCLEYWGSENPRAHLHGRDERGLLGDKSAMSGTDSDIAIAYRNQAGELCLWLIEHKLTEAEFTTCGGAVSKGRTKDHSCDLDLMALLSNKKACYYHSARGFRYWDITEGNVSFFSGAPAGGGCPFREGANQLWRNQLLALAKEQADANEYKHVTFSVVKHPRNQFLDSTIQSYRKLIGDTQRFSAHDSTQIVVAAEALRDQMLSEWAAWIRNLYDLR